MGLAGGPNLKEDGLLFYYDTGNNVKSYKGKPATNTLTTVSYSYGTQDGTYLKSNYGLENAFIPALNKAIPAHYVNFYNDYNGGSGNCCPAPFFFGDITVSANTTYTYQIIFKTKSGYYHPNYMYRYEYNVGTYITEGGFVNGGRMEDLGDGWKHAWGTFTTNASTNRIIAYFFHYEYAVYNKMQIAGVMLTQGTQIIPPSQFIPINTTRSNTQGLLDVAGNSTLDLSNVSFDSNAQMTFDGTDDLLDVTTNFGILSAYTFEYVAYANSSNNMPLSSRTSTAFYKYGANSWRYTHGGVGGEFYHAAASATGWAHWVITYDGGTISVWENGVSKGTSSSSGTADFSGGIRIGSWTSSASYTWDGTIPIMKMYNRALTAAEVKQNFQGIRNRFNL